MIKGTRGIKGIKGIKLSNKKDWLIFIISATIMGLVLSFVLPCFAGVETVKDDNDGNAGYILINTGTRNGQSDVGHWTDISDIPELKGEKGDTGAQGIQGIAGKNGKDGINGLNGKDGIGINGLDGKDGYTPIKGVDYVDGIDGVNGIDGMNGVDGVDGYTPIKGVDYNDGVNGADGLSIKGDKGDIGINGKDVDPITVTNLQNEDINLNNKITDNSNILNNHSSQLANHESRINDLDNRVGKLEQTQFKVQAEFRILDTKHFTISPYISQNFTRNKIDEVGLRVTVKLCKSYEEKEIIKTNSRIERLEQYLALPEVKEGIEQAQMRKIKVNTDGKSLWIGKQF